MFAADGGVFVDAISFDWELVCGLGVKEFIDTVWKW